VIDEEMGESEVGKLMVP